MRITAGLGSLGDASHLTYYMSTSPFRTKVGPAALHLTLDVLAEDADPSLAAEEEEDSVHLAVRKWIVVQRMTAFDSLTESWQCACGGTGININVNTCPVCGSARCAYCLISKVQVR